jgi:hypothetical protein
MKEKKCYHIYLTDMVNRNVGVASLQEIEDVIGQ